MSKYLGEKKRDNKRVLDKLEDLFAMSSDDDVQVFSLFSAINLNRQKDKSSFGLMCNQD